MDESTSTALPSADYRVGGRPTTVQSLGSGAPVVFLHGTGTFPGFPFAERWSATRRVIVPYHPGFGGSNGETLGTVKDYVAHYCGLLDRLGIEAVDLVGFSLGGWIAAELAARHPKRVRKLVLVSPAGLVVDEAPAPDMSTIAPDQMPAYLTHDPQVTLSYIPTSPDAAFGERLGKELEGFAKLVGENPQGDPSLAQRLGAIRARTLLVWGAEDRLRPTTQSRSWQAQVPRCRVEILSGIGHLVFEESPDAADLVLAFLDKG